MNDNNGQDFDQLVGERMSSLRLLAADDENKEDQREKCTNSVHIANAPSFAQHISDTSGQSASSQSTIPEAAFTYPRASFLGLPTELRLQIYAYIAKSIHVHLQCVRSPGYLGFPHNETWRSKKWWSNVVLCHCTASTLPFGHLCNKFLFPEPFLNLENSDTGRANNHPFALRFSCRLVYHETYGILEPNKLRLDTPAGIVVDRSRLNLSKHLAFHGMEHIKHLVLAPGGYEPNRHCGIDINDGRRLRRDIWWLHKRRDQFPNLRVVTVQQLRMFILSLHSNPTIRNMSIPSLQNFRDSFVFHRLHSVFMNLTVILEWWVYEPAKRNNGASDGDKMVYYRGVSVKREESWSVDPVKIETFTVPLETEMNEQERPERRWNAIWNRFDSYGRLKESKD